MNTPSIQPHLPRNLNLLRKELSVVPLLFLMAAANLNADVIIASTRANILYVVDTTALTATALGPANGGSQFNGLAITPGTEDALVGRFATGLWSGDASTGAVSPTSLPGPNLGWMRAMDHAPDGQLWGYNDLSGPDQLATVNEITGSLTNVGARFQQVASMAFYDGTPLIWVPTTGLSSVNLTDGTITDVNAAVVGTTMNGMVQGNDGVLYGGNGTNLYSINAVTGVETLLGPLTGMSGNIEGFAVLIPEPSTVLPLGWLMGTLLIFGRQRRKLGQPTTAQ